MKYFITTIIFLIGMTSVAHALVISEIMSNPIGDDSGREWIELYNNGEDSVDISNLTLSVKGGAFLPVTPVSGGTIIAGHSYGIIGSTVGGITKFLQDYATYNGPLLRSTVSLVNTGVTSIEIRLQGVSADTISSYTAAKEGSTYSLVNGSFIVTNPTPGEENKATVTVQDDTAVTPTQTGTVSTLPATSAPSADIVLYLPKEKMVVAGAPSTFSTYGMTRAGKTIENIRYTWSFGDGGQRTGSSTVYRYFYPGRYIVEVDGTNGLVAGIGRMVVRVVSPEIHISTIGFGKYGNYIDVTNPSPYELDISGWRFSVDGAGFPFPQNTILANGITRFSGIAMGFASTSVATSTVVALLFPNMEEVLRVTQGEVKSFPTQELKASSSNSSSLEKKISSTLYSKSNRVYSVKNKIQPAIPSVGASTTISVTQQRKSEKDTRIASFFRSIFK